jgi:hypothetical protein
MVARLFSVKSAPEADTRNPVDIVSKGNLEEVKWKTYIDFFFAVAMLLLLLLLYLLLLLL